MMMNDSYGTGAFPRLMAPPPVPRTRNEPRPLNQYHAHMDRPPSTNPIAHAIAHAIMNSHHLHQVQHFAQMGLNDGIQAAIANRVAQQGGVGVGGGYQSPFGPPPVGMLPQLSPDYQPSPSPFSRF